MAEIKTLRNLPTFYPEEIEMKKIFFSLLSPLQALFSSTPFEVLILFYPQCLLAHVNVS